MGQTQLLISNINSSKMSAVSNVHAIDFERLHIRHGIGEEADSAENLTSNRDFAATLVKAQSLGSNKSENSEDKAVRTSLGAKFEELDVPQASVLETDLALDLQNEDEVIQEMKEDDTSNGSHSKINSKSVHSLLKKPESNTISLEEPNVVNGNNAIQVTKSMDVTKAKHGSTRNLYEINKSQKNSAIRSVYEMEAAGIKSGQIKAHSGKGSSTVGGQKRRTDDNTNTDL